MKDQIDIKTALKQHLEMDAFFAGDFTVKGQLPKVGQAQLTQNSEETLETISTQIIKCEKCRLFQTRTNAVPGQGNASARLVFVGEAPGADEDARGIPFIGRAGRLLDKIIAAMGMSRQDIFIGNILKCRPPGNRDPRPDEIVNCSPYLHRQLELIGPEIIVALGAHAAKTLLETTKPIGQLRGRFHNYYTSLNAKPIKLMPTYHPAYLLRNHTPDNRRRVWDDMKKVLTELKMPLPQPNKKQSTTTS